MGILNVPFILAIIAICCVVQAVRSILSMVDASAEHRQEYAAERKIRKKYQAEMEAEMEAKVQEELARKADTVEL